jgi:hypothetical protein
MDKQETIKYLTDLMATVQMAYFKGRMEGRSPQVHERSDNSAAISVDLYHFGGDGEPVCEGLKPCTLVRQDGTTEDVVVFCVCYDPDNERYPLTFLVIDDGEDKDEDDIYDVVPDELPFEAVCNVTAWLEAEMRKEPEKPKEPEKLKNDVTSFFFYMWNAWCKEECQKVWEGCNWQHFWDKWVGIYKAYGVQGAAERFYAELSNSNRDRLVRRALEVYDGDSERKEEAA